jgi:hypothetical protein
MPRANGTRRGRSVITAAADHDATALLARVRELKPGELLRLATLWAGIRDGSLDPGRQRRRSAARIALRLATRTSDAPSSSIDSERAVAAVREVLAGPLAGSSIALRGPAADAAWAVADALDAIRHRDRLTVIAHEELLRPWRELLAELAPG